MKFFSEFVSCCRHPGCCSPPLVAVRGAAEEDETESLAPSRPGRRNRRRLRVRTGSLSGEEEWKPSLCTISEDSSVSKVTEKENTTDRRPEGSEATPRIVKRKSGSHSRVHRRSYSDDYGRSHVPVVIPAFSPTPFMV